MTLLLALLIIAFFVFLAVVAWKFIPWVWAKWLVAGIFGFFALYKLIVLLNAMTGGVLN